MENKKSLFLKHAFILSVASLLVRLIGFIYRIPLTNMLGDEGNGIYSSGYYLYNFFLVMSSAGLPVAISKLISERISLGYYTNAKKVFKISIILSITLGLASCLIMFFAAEWFCVLIDSPKSYYTILTLSPTVLIVSIMSVFRGYFQGIGTTTPTALSQVIEQIFNAIFSIYLAYILIDFGVEFGAAGGTAGTGIGALAGLIYILILFIFKRKNIDSSISNNKTSYKIETSREIIIKIIKTVVPIVTGTAIFSMTNLIDMQMVISGLTLSGAFSDTEILALYGQLTGKYVTITTLPVSISTALAVAVIPSIASNVVRKETSVLKQKICTSLRLTMIISIPAAFGIGFMAKPILQLLFPSYSDGYLLLQAGALSIIFLSLCQIATGILQGIGNLKVPALNALIGCLIKIPFNYFLISIPSINVIGAVISTTVCYIVATFLNLRMLKKVTNVSLDYKDIFLKPTIASVIMSLFCILSYKLIFYFSHNNNFSTLISIFFAIIIYFFVMIIIKGFNRQDLELIPLGNKIIKVLDKFNLID